MRFICMRFKKYFLIIGFALSLEARINSEMAYIIRSKDRRNALLKDNLKNFRALLYLLSPSRPLTFA